MNECWLYSASLEHANFSGASLYEIRYLGVKLGDTIGFSEKYGSDTPVPH